MGGAATLPATSCVKQALHACDDSMTQKVLWRFLGSGRLQSRSGTRVVDDDDEGGKGG